MTSSKRRILGALTTYFLVLVTGTMGYAVSGEFKGVDWDQAANIKDAAERLAQLQRTRGADRAFQFIDACYRTHSLASKYGKAFEACIAQDYLETQALALVYSRLTPDALKRVGVPTPQALADAMGKRVTAAFATYDVPVSYVKTFKELVDEHGFPVFFQTVFPGVPFPPRKKATEQSDQE